MITQHWSHSTLTEARRLAHTTHQLATYFYQINGFYVVPQGTGKRASHTILFPDLNWSSIHRIWERASTISVDSPLPERDHKLIKEIEALLVANEVATTTLDLVDLKKAWNVVSSEVFTWLESTIPQAKAITTLNFFPTKFGSIASFNCFDESTGLVEIYLRQDASLHDLVDSLLGSLVHTSATSKLHLNWQEQEAVCDWLLSLSSLKNILDRAWPTSFEPTLGSLRQSQSHQELRAQSDRYLSHLGLSYSDTVLTLQGNSVVCKNKLMRTASQKQLQVLEQLIKHKHISQDQLADMLFEHDDDYSLYVIAKFVQRLRELLEAYGVSGSIIQTVRNQGLTLRS
jgi:hypothetical protein